MKIRYAYWILGLALLESIHAVPTPKKSKPNYASIFDNLFGGQDGASYDDGADEESVGNDDYSYSDNYDSNSLMFGGDNRGIADNYDAGLTTAGSPTTTELIDPFTEKAEHNIVETTADYTTTYAMTTMPNVETTHFSQSLEAAAQREKEEQERLAQEERERLEDEIRRKKIRDEARAKAKAAYEAKKQERKRLEEEKRAKREQEAIQKAEKRAREEAEKAQREKARAEAKQRELDARREREDAEREQREEEARENAERILAKQREEEAEIERAKEEEARRLQEAKEKAELILAQQREQENKILREKEAEAQMEQERAQELAELEALAEAEAAAALAEQEAEAAAALAKEKADAASAFAVAKAAAALAEHEAEAAAALAKQNAEEAAALAEAEAMAALAEAEATAELAEEVSAVRTVESEGDLAKEVYNESANMASVQKPKKGNEALVKLREKLRGERNRNDPEREQLRAEREERRKAKEQRKIVRETYGVKKQLSEEEREAKKKEQEQHKLQQASFKEVRAKKQQEKAERRESRRKQRVDRTGVDRPYDSVARENRPTCDDLSTSDQFTFVGKNTDQIQFKSGCGTSTRKAYAGSRCRLEPKEGTPCASSANKSVWVRINGSGSWQKTKSFNCVVNNNATTWVSDRNENGNFEVRCGSPGCPHPDSTFSNGLIMLEDVVNKNDEIEHIVDSYARMSYGRGAKWRCYDSQNNLLEDNENVPTLGTCALACENTYVTAINSRIKCKDQRLLKVKDNDSIAKVNGVNSPWDGLGGLLSELNKSAWQSKTNSNMRVADDDHFGWRCYKTQPVYEDWGAWSDCVNNERVRTRLCTGSCDDPMSKETC